MDFLWIPFEFPVDSFGIPEGHDPRQGSLGIYYRVCTNTWPYKPYSKLFFDVFGVSLAQFQVPGAQIRALGGQIQAKTMSFGPERPKTVKNHWFLSVRVLKPCYCH